MLDDEGGGMRTARLLAVFVVVILHVGAVAGQSPAPALAAPHTANVAVYDISSGEVAWHANVTASTAETHGVLLSFEFSPTIGWDRLAADVYAGEHRLNATQLLISRRSRSAAPTPAHAVLLDADTFERLVASPEATIVTERFRIALTHDDLERLRTATAR
jgi:hypothetical protein